MTTVYLLFCSLPYSNLCVYVYMCVCVICGLLNNRFFFPLHHSRFMTRTVHKKLVTSKALLGNPNKQDLTERAYNKH